MFKYLGREALQADHNSRTHDILATCDIDLLYAPLASWPIRSPVHFAAPDLPRAKTEPAKPSRLQRELADYGKVKNRLLGTEKEFALGRKGSR